MMQVLFLIFLNLSVGAIAAAALFVPRRWLRVTLLVGAAVSTVLPGGLFVVSCYVGGVVCMLGARSAIQGLRNGDSLKRVLGRYLLVSLLAFPASWGSAVVATFIGGLVIVRGEGQMMLTFVPLVVAGVYAVVFVALVLIARSEGVWRLLDEPASLVTRTVAARWWILALAGACVFVTVGATSLRLLALISETLFGKGSVGMVGFGGSLLVLQVAMASAIYAWLKYVLPPPERRPRVVLWMGVGGPLFAGTVLTAAASLEFQGEGTAVTTAVFMVYTTFTVLVSSAVAFVVKQNPDEFSSQPTTGPL